MLYLKCLIKLFSFLNSRQIIWFSKRTCMISPGQVAHLVGVSSGTPEGWGSNPGSGHIPHVAGSIPTTDQCYSLPSMFLSLPSSLSKINKHVLRWGFKKSCRILKRKKKNLYDYWPVVSSVKVVRQWADWKDHSLFWDVKKQQYFYAGNVVTFTVIDNHTIPFVNNHTMG